MNIVKQLRIKILGNMPTTPNGVLIRDGAAEYPVLSEALTNTVIFPQLLESGYKLIALPYSFEFNGVPVSSLPVEDYIPASEQEAESLYTMVGSKYNGGNLSQYLTKPTKAVIETPPTKFSIMTRDAFIKYLDDISVVNDPDDYLPLNYFVDPSALFTYQEYFDPANIKYRNIIEGRRRMSYVQFMKLFKFLQQYGINENSSAYEIVQAYFAWGIDGIRWEAASKMEDMQEYPVDSLFYRKASVTGKVRCIGLVDNKRSKIVPKKYRDKMWDFDLMTKEKVDRLCKPDDFGRVALPDGETFIADYERPVKIRTTTISCGSYYMQYDHHDIAFNKTDYIMDTLRVQSLIPGDQLSVADAIPQDSKMKEYCDDMFAKAIAIEMHKKRLVKCTASSYQLLLQFGLTPEEALRYIALRCDMTEIGEHDDTDPADVVLTDEAIHNYCIGKYNNETGFDQNAAIRDVLDNIVNGVTNCDSISAGEVTELQYRPDALYKEIKVLHDILEIPLSQIYEDVKQASVGDTLTYTGNNITRSISLTKIDYKYQGFLADKNRYTSMAASSAYNFIEVQRIAREIGNNDATRHVAMEFLLATRTAAMQRVIDWLVIRYTEMAESYISDASSRKKVLNVVEYLAIRTLFEIYRHDKITFFGIVAAPEEDVPADFINIVRSNVQLKFDTIQAVTVYSMLTTKQKSVGMWSFPSEYGFGQVCTNAFITPTQIIPKIKGSIPEVSFFALWKDYRLNTNINQKLIELGIITPDFTPYGASGGMTYCDNSFLDYNIYSVEDDMNSAAYYASQAEETLKESREHPTYVIDVVQHPVEYNYPGIYEYSDDWDVTNEPRKGMDLHIGFKRDVTKDIGPDYTPKDTDDYVIGCESFKGFDAETFYLGINVLGCIPIIKNIARQLTYSNGKFYAVDTSEIYDFTRIKELMDKGYPVTHVRNNIYLVHTFSNELLEVHI